MKELLTTNEKKWIQELFKEDFLGKDFLTAQLNNILFIERYYTDSVYSLKFKIDEKTKKYPFEVQVPIEMEIEQENKTPISFLLHIVEGYIYELEIYSMNGDTIDIKQFRFDNSKHIVNKHLKSISTNID